ncbi:MAG TPA: lipopolysaccharide kinase InaA family protein [Holophagaceae bacterium]|nr:lipopolysaccharide kinase InaA family protein [Holophagaceae bacterium]
MVHSLKPIPSPPASWPFEPRTGTPAVERREDVDIPGFGSGWMLEAAAGLSLVGPSEPLGGAFGRGGVTRLGDRVVRPYRRGGLVRHLNERTYPGPARFLEELDVHRALWAAGLPTVEPLGCAWRRHGWGVEGLYLTRWEAGAAWPRAWEAAPWHEVARILRALAAWGCWVPDLNATNVFIDARGGVRVLDFDRAAFRAPEGLEARYLARLARSLAKLGAPGALQAQVAAGLP